MQTGIQRSVHGKKHTVLDVKTLLIRETASAK